MRRKAIEKLTAELVAIEHAKQGAHGVDVDTLTEAESAFFALTAQKGKPVFRGGWPDFLMEDPESGGFLGVEVKQGNDKVRESQARMFEALERMGMRVLVWNPARRDVLTPWRKYVPISDAPCVPRAAKQVVIGRVETFDWTRSARAKGAR